ncbi:hypothetical protein MN116_005122 [Schistosoma mekongi]|uniref:tRNA (uracil-O(2)-)-methyltransferase n=1 Tax=Schistosoma mekongi TaxID=38744 RepID=A0AAE1ZD56_SCHME|nr:hypothetical protein MN116_005122 [Schistosoma mekongi]
MDSRFTAALSIWINKPQVAHKDIFASSITSESDDSILRVIYPKLRTQVNEFTELCSKGLAYKFSSIFITYIVELKSGHILVSVLDDTSGFLQSSWLKDVLEPKLNHWYSCEARVNISSLSLIDHRVYQLQYERLKNTYGPILIKNWSEKTDPMKFVYEDIGIACYLICLWKNEHVNFVDLGCGNGLLTYILSSEGFDGVGIDIRKRRIWESYPLSIQQRLKESSLNPEDFPGFPQANWLIGNHSDELTPWLPILACKTGPSCKLFILPCCPYGLFGKFNIPKSSLSFLPQTVKVNQITGTSRYGVYLNYIQQILAICGFIPEVDALRIPSTKRICIVGRNMVDPKYVDNTTHLGRLSTVNKYIEFERDLILKPNKTFVARSLTETPSNCTTVSKFVIEKISHIVFRALLSCKPNRYLLQSYNLVLSDDLKIQTLDSRWWNPGGTLTLSECSELLSLDDMKLLKSQHGGFQTVLRNRHQCFRTVKSTVQLRWFPDKMMKLSYSGPPSCSDKNGKNRKTRPCWMSYNHPDGCPYPSELCDFIHGENEILTEIASS